jgi:hypothetical protein
MADILSSLGRTKSLLHDVRSRALLMTEQIRVKGTSSTRRA